MIPFAKVNEFSIAQGDHLFKMGRIAVETQCAVVAAEDDSDVWLHVLTPGRDSVDRALDQAVLAGLGELRIIHGKGTGELRKEVLYILGQYPEVVGTGSIHDGGATEVILKYH